MTTVSHLHKDSEEDDHYGRGDEEPLLGEIIDQEDQGKADCPSQASVSDYELISKGHGIPPQLVNHSSQQQNPFRRGVCVSRHNDVCTFSILMSAFFTSGPPDEAEQQCGTNKRPAPHVNVLYGGDTQEDEDEGFAHAAPHLQEVLDAGVAALRYVGLHVLLHGHSAGHNAEQKQVDMCWH